MERAIIVVIELHFDLAYVFNGLQIIVSRFSRDLDKGMIYRAMLMEIYTSTDCSAS